MWFEQQDPNCIWRSFDFDRDAVKLEAFAKIWRPTQELEPFSRRGKLILYHGWADPAFSAYSTIDYYGEW